MRNLHSVLDNYLQVRVMLLMLVLRRISVSITEADHQRMDVGSMIRTAAWMQQQVKQEEECMQAASCRSAA
jgi:hypothetical protein